ncbi:RING-H2 finger protein ATL16-like [Impatiens glandulifera]|uniref:RING-H2 finger protein ATL16-like n=1 Tax=Impatiens glandulifera TaxID=253017 RepID=UPI001FB0BF35|nr:RING-H2 finger protein ATL16-like [Impatiens glandulifera]
MADSQQNPLLSNRRFLTSSEANGFPVLAMAILCILATVFLLISYYIFLNKCNNCCFFSPFSRHQTDHTTNSNSNSNSPPFSLSSPINNRGLDEILIRNIPVFQYNNGENRGGKEWNECAVCLSDFRDQEMLRILPRCSHAFHLDCIDIWLQSNANCPLCRTCISGRKRFPADLILAPTSSPHPINADEDFLVIELADGSETRTPVDEENYRRRRKTSSFRQRRRVSMMGDETVREKDDDFSSVQPIRRSFSMDSAADRQVYLWVQEITAREESASGRARRSFFSFGHGRGSRSSWVLPVEF